MEVSGFGIDLIIILVAAIAGGMLARRARLPVLLGYLVGGIIVGPYGFGLVKDLATVDVLANIGVILLLFTLGLEFSLKEVRRIGRIAILGGLAQILLTAAVGLALGRLLGWAVFEAVFFGFLIALSSTMIVLKTLMERGELDTRHGRIMIGILLVQDLSVVPLMIILPAVGGGEAGLLVSLGLAALKAMAFIGVMLVLGIWVLPWLLGRVARERSGELFLLTLVTLCLAAAFGTYFFGLSAAFGAFVAGLLISQSAFARQALANVIPLRDTFVAIFFISLGMLADPRFIADNIIVIVIVVAVIITAKFIICFLIPWFFGHSFKTSLFVGTGLIQIGEFSFILAGIGIGAGVISGYLYSLTLASAIITMLLTPFALNLASLLYRRLSQRGKIGRMLAARQGPDWQVDQQHLSGHAVICGYGRVGSQLARVLERRKFDYLAAREAGIKPIIGCEVYVAPNGRLNRNAADKTNYHLVLLARNLTGYQNLIQLTSEAHLNGFYYKPRVDKELLKQHSDGLIALSACLQGEVPRLIMEGNHKEAREAALWYQQTFGDFYLEIQRHPMPELEQVNQHLIPLGRELDIPLVATNDVHYVNKEDAATHDLLLCIGTNSSVNDEKRMKMAGDFFYLKSPQEMAEQFQDIPQALENTGRIAEQCDLEIEFGRLHLPEIELPEGKTPFEFLSDLCREGLPQHYPQPTDEIKQRMEYELDVIRQTEFANYFLVVWDIISFARQNHILFGVRGSAAASIVLYCLNITDIDPIAHKLVFERFLNIARKEMPDIDMDFADDRRDEVIAYVSRRYGQDHVAQIITFGTLGARAALRDVGRALGMPYSEVDRVARLIPVAINITLEQALNENEELRNIYQADPIVRKLVDSAKRVEGTSRHASTHAAGIVISREPLTRHVPLQRASKGNGEGGAMTQLAMEDIARIGLLKMDILGLINLTVLGKARDIIRENRDVDIDLRRIPLDDGRTFELLSSGETAGVFQLEGAGMRRYIKDLKPTNFSDIAAMIALYRPGPMEHIPTFIRAKQGIEPIQYPHPSLASILEETYGVIVYQEQVVFIVQTLAGYSLGEADIFRKAMSKKITEVMQKERRNFVAGAKKNGFSTEVANKVFTLIEPFAGYAFNKAHSTSYALIAYQTAYLKANYPAEYMTAFLIANAGHPEKVATAVGETRRLGITVLPPDVNRSQIGFSIEKDDNDASAIRFGLSDIKNVGPGAVEPIVAERNQGGEFKSIEDFCRRCDLRGANKRVIESLIKAGAFDSLGSRGSLLQNINRILSLAQREQQLKETGQSTMFDLWGESTPVPTTSLELPDADIPAREKLAWEKELTGVYLSENILGSLASGIAAENATLCGQIGAEMAGQNAVVVGMVASAYNLFTRDQKPFVRAVLEDMGGRVEVMVWPRVYTDTRDLWEEGNILVVEGRVKMRDDQAQLYCDTARQYQPSPAAAEEAAAPTRPPAPERKAADTASAPPPPVEIRHLIVNLAQTSDEAGDYARLYKIINALRNFPGDDEVNLRVINGTKIIKLKLSNMYTNYCPELHQQLVALAGEDEVKLETPNSS
ncbi:DNA polymerase III subunit alpha [Chloroflexota bacterium]